MSASLIGLSTTELCNRCASSAFPAFRGKQIADWIYRKGVVDPLQMSNLPKPIKDWLASETIGCPEIVNRTDSKDGSTKLLLKLADEESIESVLLPYKDRVSLCVSTQVGCPLGCVFCATGASGFSRNLTIGEIVGQYIAASSVSTSRISHVVMMGMGEPFLNLDNALGAINILEEEIGISARHITISTIGIPDQIRRLATKKLQFTLAISLHAPNQTLRTTLMPAVKKYPLVELISACKYYSEITRRRLTFEYLLIDDINDKPQHAHELCKLLQDIPCHVNLIPYNPVSSCDFLRSSRKNIDQFKAILESKRISVTQRFERGTAADSACGQLKRSADS